MNPTEPHFLYMVLILPSLFGLTLIGEGMHKIMNEKSIGWVSIISGIGFIVIIIFSYFLLSGNILS